MANTLLIGTAKTALVFNNPLTYYFDASDGGPTDPDARWTSDANAFDGSTATLATAGGSSGSTSSQYLLGEGTNAPSSGNDISFVRARVYTSTNGPDGHSHYAAIYTDSLGELLGTASKTDIGNGLGWSDYVTLSTPTGGWTWAKVQALETKLYVTDGGAGSPGVYRVEIDVFAPAAPEPSLRNRHPVLKFDDTIPETAYFTGTMPRNYSGGDITVYVHYATTSATTGTAGWLVAFERIGDGSQDIDSDGFASDQTITAVTVPGTSGNVDIVSVTVSNANADAIAAGESFRLRIKRDVANDTASGDLELIGVELVEA